MKQSKHKLKQNAQDSIRWTKTKISLFLLFSAECSWIIQDKTFYKSAKSPKKRVKLRVGGDRKK